MFPRLKVFYLLYCIILVNVVFLHYHSCIRIKPLEMPAIQKRSNNCDNAVIFLMVHVNEKRPCMRLAPIINTLRSTCGKKSTRNVLKKRERTGMERI